MKAKASAAETGGCIVVEGFLLLQCAELVDMADILVIRFVLAVFVVVVMILSRVFIFAVVLHRL